MIGCMATRSRLAGFLIAALASACALAPPGSGTRPQYHVHPHDGRYVLDRPFADFYDTAFVRTDGGRLAPRVVGVPELARLLAHYDVVVYGETHTHPGVHLAQMNLLRALHDRDPRWILSLEQFERDVQGVVDDYLAARIGESAFAEKSRAWNNYATSYRPLLIYAREEHLPVVAAEAPGWEVSCVGQWGTAIFDRFTPQERSWVAADVQPAPGAYHDKFTAFLGGSPSHGGGGAGTPEARERAERSFAAQVTRDDTMAESIDRALREHPGYKLLHLTGSFHAEGFLGTVERLRQIDPKLKVAVIDPIEVENPAAPAFDADAVHDGTVLELLYPTPDMFVPGEDMSAFGARMRREHEAAKCKYSP